LHWDPLAGIAETTRMGGKKTESKGVTGEGGKRGKERGGKGVERYAPTV